MPSRSAVAVILAFWLATSGFVAYRDVWPRLFASGPPPVAIELADEARQNVPAKWTLYRNGQKVGRLTTLMKYLDAEDAFQFTYRYTELKLEQAGVTLEVSEAVSDVHITRDSTLKSESLAGKVKVSVLGLAGQGTVDVRGVVANGLLTGRAELKSDLGTFAGDLDPVPVKRGEQPLNPLQPVNRLHVRGGMQWAVFESNPLHDAVFDLLQKEVPGVGSLYQKKAKESLVAAVDSSPQVLSWQGQDVPCWVIEYRRAEPVARVWVRTSDGKVLRQEVSEKGESVTFERED
jgi:hypothetical protein